MKFRNNSYRLILMVSVILSISGCQGENSGQSSSKIPETGIQKTWIDQDTHSDTNNEIRNLVLDEGLFREQLNLITLEKATSDDSSNAISLPLPDGSEIIASVELDELVSDDYKDDLPDNRTWSISTKDDRVISGTVSYNLFGFSAMLLMSDGKTVYIDPQNKGDNRSYISYNEGHTHDGIACDVDHSSSTDTIEFAERFVNNFTNTQKRTYRFAPVATPGFHHKFGWANGKKHVVHTWNHMYTMLARMRVILRRDLSVDLRMIGSANTQVLTTTVEDFTIGDVLKDGVLTTGRLSDKKIILANQAFLDNKLGTANYDLGHLFDDNGIGNGGGLAYIGTACNYALKGAAFSNWNGNYNNFAISLLAHEVGHQLGASHTYSSSICGDISGPTAVEPGAGTTIMSYGMLCGADNIETDDPNFDTDRMFHSKTIEEVQNYVHKGDGRLCGTESEYNRNPQVDLDEVRKNRLVIPSRTPFVLDDAQVLDPDNDRTWYSWEQVLPYAPQAASRLNVDTGDNAIIRAHLPTWTKERIIPSLAALTSNTRVDGEVVPWRSRYALRFRFVARDNKGGVGYDDVDIRVYDTGRPFRVLQPNNTYISEGALTVQWDVADTNIAPISCTEVDIAASQNNGRIFTTLSTNTANDGLKTINIPNWLATSQTRIRVKCSNDIFFAMSGTNPSVYTAQ